MLENLITKHKGLKALIITAYIIYLLAVFYLCFFNIKAPEINLSEYFLGIPMDKVAHFLMFLPFTFISYLSYKYVPILKTFRKYCISLSFVTGVIIAAATEIIQALFINGREGDILDFFADIVAISITTIALNIYHYYFRKTSSPISLR